MITTMIDGAEIAYHDSQAAGDPLLLIHGGGLAGWMTPLAAELRGHRVLGAAAVDDAASRSGPFFTSEIPAIGGWTFDPAVARPVVLVQGADSPPPVHRLIAHLAGLLPQATVETVENAGHLMPLTTPAGVAAAIARLTDAVGEKR